MEKKSYRNKAVNKEQEEVNLLIEVRAVAEKLRKGWSRSKIVDYLMTELGMSQTTAYARINKALEWISLSDADLIDKAREVQMERLDDILEQVLKEKNFNAAIKCLDLQNKLQGLYENKVSVATPEDSTITFKIG